jgi:hypothetical protein
MVDLLDNFLDLMKLFLAVESDFIKIAITENGRGKERKMNGGSSTADHMKDRRKRLKQKLFQTEKKILRHTSYYRVFCDFCFAYCFAKYGYT